MLDLARPVRPDDLRTVAKAIRLTGERRPGRPGPGYRADSDAVLEGAGYTPDGIAHLRALGRSDGGVRARTRCPGE
jgi:hypothetical protein